MVGLRITAVALQVGDENPMIKSNARSVRVCPRDGKRCCLSASVPKYFICDVPVVVPRLYTACSECNRVFGGIYGE